MRALLLGLCVSAGLAAGCGGITPTAFCTEFQTEVCTRAYECYTPDQQATAEFQGTYGVSLTDCENKLEAAAGCATANSQPCANPAMHFHSDTAEACEKDVKDASCDDVTSMALDSTHCMTICS